MTTMELNLRKKYLYDLIKGMDEERLSKVETYIKRLWPDSYTHIRAHETKANIV